MFRSKPLSVSLVTISYNQASFLRQAIESVVRQKARDRIQYIVVDPGSTDRSRDIIEAYRPSIDVISYEADNGPADGLNKGFATAEGDVFGFLNSDDILYPDAVSAALQWFEKEPDVDVVSAHGFAIDEKGRKLRRIFSDKFSARSYAYGGCSLVQQSTFFRRSAFLRAGGFNIDNISSWDGELFVTMALNGARFGRVNAFWSEFRLHRLGISGSGRLDADAAWKSYRAQIFEKIIGREERASDQLYRAGYRLLKHTRTPRGLWERLTAGDVHTFKAVPTLDGDTRASS